MRGFRLIALSPKGEIAVKRYNVKDKRAVVGIVCDEPLTLSMVFHQRYRMALTEMAIETFVNTAMKGHGCKEGEDYDLEMLE